MIRKIDVVWNRLVEAPSVLAQLRRSGVRTGRALVLLGRPLVSLERGSTIEIGDRSTLVSASRWTALGVSRPVILRTLRPGAGIRLGEDVGLSGTTVCSARRVHVGDRVLIGADVVITDTDFHPLDHRGRLGAPVPEGSEADAVTIEDDVFIGARSIVLKGVTIGARSVVGAGSVVTRSVPADSIVAGNPARVLRSEVRS